MPPAPGAGGMCSSRQAPFSSAVAFSLQVTAAISSCLLIRQRQEGDGSQSHGGRRACRALDEHEERRARGDSGSNLCSLPCHSVSSSG
eukprot:764423-Hanusia_phi.AAC.2